MFLQNGILSRTKPALVYVEMAAFSGRPDKFLGVHFFNPVQVNFPNFRKLAIYSLVDLPVEGEKENLQDDD